VHREVAADAAIAEPAAAKRRPADLVGAIVNEANAIGLADKGMELLNSGASSDAALAAFRAEHPDHKAHVSRMKGLGEMDAEELWATTMDPARRTLLQISVEEAVIADEVLVPDDWTCCAFAGDRGMLHPELTASATAAMATNSGSDNPPSSS
jgi:hypothetical protein